MKVIVVDKIKNWAYDTTFKAKLGTATIAITNKLYHTFTTILGVYVSVDAARKAIENEKMELIEMYGEKALDDENIGDMHTYYTFVSSVLELDDNESSPCDSCNRDYKYEGCCCEEFVKWKEGDKNGG